MNEKQMTPKSTRPGTPRQDPSCRVMEGCQFLTRQRGAQSRPQESTLSEGTRQDIPSQLCRDPLPAPHNPGPSCRQTPIPISPLQKNWAPRPGPETPMESSQQAPSPIQTDVYTPDVPHIFPPGGPKGLQGKITGMGGHGLRPGA